MIIRVDALKTDHSIMVPAHCIINKRGQQVASRLASKIKNQGNEKNLLWYIKREDRDAAWKIYLNEGRRIVAGYYKAYDMDAPRQRISLLPRYEHLRETKTRIQWYMLAPDMEVISKVIVNKITMLSSQWHKPAIVNPFPPKSDKWEEFNLLVEKHLPRYDSISL
jgi:hypothetical protein